MTDVSPDRMTVTWWGHSTATLDDGGTRLLTDPVLGGYVAHLRRRGGPQPAVEAFRADAALVSHMHADHLDVPSLRRLPSGTELVVPRGTAALLRGRNPGLAARCTEMVPGDETRIGSLLVRAVPAAHDGARGPWSRQRGPALGYVVTGSATVWFAGDTALHPAMDSFGPLDLGLIPVGGWGPTLGPGHMDPAGAVEAARRTGCVRAVPIHYGTLWPIGLDRVRPDRFHGPGDEFARLADGATAVTVLTQGGHVEVAPAAGHR